MPRPKLKYFIQCDEIRNDNGKFSALGLFDTIFSFVFPTAHNRFFLLLGFTGEPGRHDLDLELRAPDGSPLGVTKGELTLPTADHLVNVVFAFENLPLPAEGRYSITLFLDGDFHADHHFAVRAPVAPVPRSREEIEALLARPETIKSAHAEIACERCGARYRFQMTLDPAAPVDAGCLRFPPGDEFACGGCANRIALGRIRMNLQNVVGIDHRWISGQPQGQPGQPPQ